MKPDKLSVALRPRTGWEAVDLGLRLAQRCRGVLFGISTLLVVSLALLAFLLCELLDIPRPWAFFLVWWLKPFYDRALLFVLSRAVFDETPSLRACIRSLPALFWRTGLLAALTVRRFGPQRALCLPVVMLEGLSGGAAGTRRGLLQQRVGSYGLGLMFGLLGFELIFLGSAYALFEMVTFFNPINVTPPPDDLGAFFLQKIFQELWDYFQAAFSIKAGLLANALGLLAYALTVACLEPFYAAGGFALYLKRRTDLEAWDVELQFRRLRDGAARLLATLCVAALVLASGGFPAPAHAQDDGAQKREAAAQNAGKVIKEVLKHPDFGGERTEKKLVWKEDEEPERFSGLSFLSSLFGGLSAVAQMLIYALLAACLLIVLWVVVRNLRAWRHGSSLGRRRPPAEIMGMDIRPDSLPTDIVDAARKLFAQGAARQALALLYRAALSKLAHHEGIAFEVGDTEGDCVMRITRAASPARAAFVQLTRAWQAVAYAEQTLSLTEGEQICAAWRVGFGAYP